MLKFNWILRKIIIKILKNLMEPSSNKDFGTKDYWNKRFEIEKNYDWLVNYSDFSL